MAKCPRKTATSNRHSLGWNPFRRKCAPIESCLGGRADCFDAAFCRAWRAALAGVIPSLFVLAVLATRHVAPVELLLTSAVNVAALVGGSVMYVLAVGFVSGRVAHRFAYETEISVPTLARLIAWVANLSLWGWTVLLVLIAHSR